MKTLKYIFALSVLMAFFSCKKDKLDYYHGNNSIYFQGGFDGLNNTGQFVPVDTGFFSFGYVGSHIRDSTYYVQVIATGMEEKVDRTYSLEILGNNTLKEGVDFDFKDRNFVIKAGQLRDTISLILHRTEAMTKGKLDIKLELQANENFQTEMSSKEIGSGNNSKTHYYTQFALAVDDIVGQPTFWNPLVNSLATRYILYLGAYSSRKFQLLISRYNLNIAEVTSPSYKPSTTVLLAWGIGTQAYLNEMAALGTPILEEDGTLMKMGTAAQ